MKRCINLDWLEVFLIESKDHRYDAPYWRLQGYNVKERVYGTRQYRQMFTLLVGDIPLYEIRRDPLSKKSNGGILEDGATHIRFCNRTCYLSNPIVPFIEFIKRYHYTYKNISRFDIALDFQIFDSGEKPEDFIRRYMEGEVSKIHQSKLASYGLEKNVPDKTEEGWQVAAHGKDSWNSRIWNSLKWGAPTSSICTKLYNKSLELSGEGHHKPYIEDAWKAADLTEDLPVWRIEFSVLSGKRHMIEHDSGKLFEVTLDSFLNRESILLIWESFFAQYFDFRQVRYNAKGESIRKDRCPQIVFFYNNAHQEVYEPKTITKQKDADRTDKILIRRLREIIQESQYDEVTMVEACSEVIKYLYHKRRHTGITREELIERANDIAERKANQPLPLRPYTDHLIEVYEREVCAKPKAVQ